MLSSTLCCKEKSDFPASTIFPRDSTIWLWPFRRLQTRVAGLTFSDSWGASCWDMKTGGQDLTWSFTERFSWLDFMVRKSDRKWWELQDCPLGHEHLNIGRTKLHSSMTFIWACSVCSPFLAIRFLNRSIHSRKTVCKVIFSMPPRTPSTAARSWSASSNERPVRHLLTYPKR
jgi:hypothetical protein